MKFELIETPEDDSRSPYMLGVVIVGGIMSVFWFCVGVAIGAWVW